MNGQLLVAEAGGMLVRPRAERGLIESVQDIEWLRNKKPAFDFLTRGSEAVGCSTILMMMRYAHLAPEVAREAVQLLNLDGQHWGSRAAQPG